MKTICDEMWYIVEYSVVNISLPHCVWLVIFKDKNNNYTSYVNSEEPWVEPNFIHQLHIYANTVICVIINML